MKALSGNDEWEDARKRWAEMGSARAPPDIGDIVWFVGPR